MLCFSWPEGSNDSTAHLHMQNHIHSQKPRKTATPTILHIQRGLRKGAKIHLLCAQRHKRMQKMSAKGKLCLRIPIRNPKTTLGPKTKKIPICSPSLCLLTTISAERQKRIYSHIHPLWRSRKIHSICSYGHTNNGKQWNW